MKQNIFEWMMNIYDKSHNYLIFQPISISFTMLTGDTETIITWISKILPEESIELSSTPANVISSKLKWNHNSKILVQVNKSCNF